MDKSIKLMKIQDSVIKEYMIYKEAMYNSQGRYVFERAGEISAYNCILSYFEGIDVEDETRITNKLMELFGVDVPDNIISRLVVEYYNSEYIDLNYWEGVEDLIELHYQTNK